MRRLAIIIFLLFILSVIAVIGFWSYFRLPAQPQDKQTRIFVVQKGEGLSSIADRLFRAGLIKNPYVFRLEVIRLQLTDQIQAGSFRLSPSLTNEQIGRQLTRGQLDVWVTLPEGWRREQIALRLADSLPGFKTQEFLDQTAKLEGYLFPDTYLIPQNATTAQVIKILTDYFAKQVNETLLSQALGRGLSPEKLIIMASLIEREVKFEVDRPIVAGILFNRLQANWPLQVDATVQYVLGSKTDWWPIVSRIDLQKTNSPYNTYRNTGLPPAPICNPGLSAIRAVVNASSTDYWYYISDSAGRLHYAKTLEEHNANIRQFLN